VAIQGTESVFSEWNPWGIVLYMVLELSECGVHSLVHSGFIFHVLGFLCSKMYDLRFGNA
jgi:hypothetical protein